MRTFHNVEQGTEEWHALRRQYPLTASKAQAIAAQGKGLETLCYTKMSEVYSSGEVPNFSGDDTDRGNELEPQARSIYELRNGVVVEQVGFVTDDEISAVGGASPDGMVEEDGLFETKAHNDLIHFKKINEWKKTGKFKIDMGYQWQMQQQMLFTGRKWCDHAIYNPNFKDSLLVQRVERDETMIQKLLTGLAMGEIIINEIKSNLS